MATYRELGERLGADICVSCSLNTTGKHGINHQAGAWDRQGRFHWAERALRRTSIRKFVWRLSAQKASVPVPPAPMWLRYWYRVRWAVDALKTLRIRLPAQTWEHERATLRALLAMPDDARGFFVDPFFETRQAARRAANRWAKKPIDPAPHVDYDD